MLRLTRLMLSQFRNYEGLTWQPRGRMAVVYGDNGSGKTNLLEAISLLAPGRGLRSARIAELARHGSPSWAVAGRFTTPLGEADIGTGTAPDAAGDRRVFRLDGAAPRSQAEIASRIAAIWLTPQMDRLFQENATGRRRFLDRLVLALEPGHARETAGFDTAMTQRNRLLAERAGGARDAAWLAGLEDAMARHAVAVTASRLALASRLNLISLSGVAGQFPAATLSVSCPIGDRLAVDPALAVEDWLRESLAGSRVRDAAAGSAALGAHRADMALADAASGQPASLASTGQQKALLIGVILGHSALLHAARGSAPILLLDEPVVHLDRDRRKALFDALALLPAQVVLTGTDRDVFLPLRGTAEGLRIEHDGLLPDPDFSPG